jgi:dTDP-4-amino-4,6-dideoxygalactose transaminase
MRTEFLDFSPPSIGEEEIAEVVDTLRSKWITTGPKTKKFEEEFASYVGAKHAIGVNSCTAGLHLSLVGLGIGPGDEVITSPLTFTSSVATIVHAGATPVLADVCEDTFNIDPEQVLARITPKTKAIIPVDFGGHPADILEIRKIAERHGIPVIEDAAHAAGAKIGGRMIGSLSNTTSFSFYATKNMTTGEGGMVTTDDAELANRIRVLSLHGISKDAWKRYSKEGSWRYDVLYPGFKYNMTDIAAAIGLHQLKKLDGFLERRARIAALYNDAFAKFPELTTPASRSNVTHAWHLYPIQLRSAKCSRDTMIEELKNRNIGTSVHFIPIHYHSWYKEHLGYKQGDYPVAERIFEGILSLPMNTAMSDSDAQDVIQAIEEILR